ncbi:hypothetical protein G3489_19530 [Shewanella baltica]|uniref:hypothetical protein n=1 Tax=Shewanella baltica TaxID=62322 RepID=UPI00217D3035|nr:hypothetical protein [Shewanella baltica]MCS6271869.1 hypothetical protein [Shewanella baltica]
MKKSSLHDVAIAAAADFTRLAELATTVEERKSYLRCAKSSREFAPKLKALASEFEGPELFSAVSRSSEVVVLREERKLRSRLARQ